MELLRFPMMGVVRIAEVPVLGRASSQTSRPARPASPLAPLGALEPAFRSTVTMRHSGSLAQAWSARDARSRLVACQSARRRERDGDLGHGPLVGGRDGCPGADRILAPPAARTASARLPDTRHYPPSRYPAQGDYPPSRPLYEDPLYQDLRGYPPRNLPGRAPAGLLRTGPSRFCRSSSRPHSGCPHSSRPHSGRPHSSRPHSAARTAAARTPADPDPGPPTADLAAPARWRAVGAPASSAPRGTCRGSCAMTVVYSRARSSAAASSP